VKHELELIIDSKDKGDRALAILQAIETHRSGDIINKDGGGSSAVVHRSKSPILAMRTGSKMETFS
jgi:hypothetical protein